MGVYSCDAITSSSERAKLELKQRIVLCAYDDEVEGCRRLRHDRLTRPAAARIQ
jgi:hypothetical protein